MKTKIKIQFCQKIFLKKEIYYLKINFKNMLITEMICLI